MRVKALFVCIALLVSSSLMAADTVQSITKDEAIADVSQFFSTLQRVHPDLLAKVSVDDYLKLKQQTLDDIDKNLDTDGKINVKDLAYSLCYAAAFFKDGHTAVWYDFWPDKDIVGSVKYPPLVLSYDNGFIISSSTDQSLVGLRITSVNGKPIEEYLKPILDRISGETIAFKARCFCNNQEYWYAFSKLCNSSQSLNLDLKTTAGAIKNKSVEIIAFSDFDKLHNDWWKQNTQSQKRREGTQVEFLDSNKIAHLIYPAFHNSEDEKKKIDGIFQAIKANKCENLIIDIRGNGGGSSNIGDFIFSYLYGGKFCQFSKVRVKISKDVDPELKDWELPSDFDGMIVDLPLKEEQAPKPDAFFSGRTFLLVDNNTYSSASDFATAFRDYKVGKIIGYETGGLPICFGDVHSFELTNSRINCGVSYKTFLNPRPRPGDNEHGVIPDIPMNDKLLKPYQKSDDPVLAYTLNYLKADSTPIYWQP